MKFCVEHTDINTDKLADEVVFIVTPQVDIVKIVSYLEELRKQNPTQTYVFSYSKADPFTDDDLKSIVSFLSGLIERGYNISAQLLFEPSFKDLRDYLYEREIPFFYSNTCHNMEELYIMINEGASQIYVHGTLAFCLKDIASVRETAKIRVIVDAPVLSDAEARIVETKPECLFWIRPEDVAVYDQYVDMFEIGYRPAVKLLIYMKQAWEGYIQDLIPATKIKVFGNNLSPAFGLARLNCRQQCFVGSCNLCKNAIDFAKTLSDNKLEITEKEKNI
jgi:hypothetical protein